MVHIDRILAVIFSGDGIEGILRGFAWKGSLACLAMAAVPFALDKAFPDVAFGPKFTDGYWGLEATLYDMFMMAPENQKRDPIPFGTILEASVYHRPGGKVVGVGAEYFAFSAFDIPNEIKPLMCLIPNPQAMVSLYGDGKPGVAASVFFMMLAIPYVEYDFKLRKVAAGAMLKFPILASGQ